MNLRIFEMPTKWSSVLMVTLPSFGHLPTVAVDCFIFTFFVSLDSHPAVLTRSAGFGVLVDSFSA